jgi:hypothetical protein
LIQPEAFIDESMAKDWLDLAANTLRPAKDGSMDFVDGKVVRIDRAHPALAAIDLHAIPQRDWVRQFD